MKPNDSPTSRATLWTYTLFIAVPLLYLLTTPPLLCFVMSDPDIPKFKDIPRFVELYATPASMLRYSRPFARIYEPYWNWCEKRI